MKVCFLMIVWDECVPTGVLLLKDRGVFVFHYLGMGVYSLVVHSLGMVAHSLVFNSLVMGVYSLVFLSLCLSLSPPLSLSLICLWYCRVYLCL